MKTRELAAIAKGHVLQCPEVGVFRAHVALGDLVRAGGVLGELETLGVVSRVVSPAAGIVTAIAAPGSACGYGAELATLDPDGGPRASAEGPRASDLGPPESGAAVFRAPTSGRFYVRPAPGKPAFVEAGSVLVPGTTIGLLEVMKTFHRVTYAGERARVAAVLVADGADVNAGEPLLSLA
jgi:acetyl-CoA carboxylase biotin carboxyl carrier protein